VAGSGGPVARGRSVLNRDCPLEHCVDGIIPNLYGIEQVGKRDISFQLAPFN
jgi:hypothetical protein